MQSKRKTILTILLFCFVIACFAIASLPYLQKTDPPAADGRLELRFLDVGQGDSTLVVCDGHAMLIDGGPAKSSDRIYATLKQLQIDHLDYIVATHPHNDHVGGLSGALNYASVGMALSPVPEADGRAFQSFLKYLRQQNVEITVPSPGDTFSLSSASFTVLAPLDMVSEMNSNSIVLRLTYGGFHALFTGDAESDEEQSILQSDCDLQSDVLKVGHHGGLDACSEDWLRKVSPKISVISSGAGNEYGHPSEQTIRRLESVGSEVLRTDQLGDILIVVLPDGTISRPEG